MTDLLLDQDPKLAEMVRRLVATLAPEQIYLFGSHARGEAVLTATTTSWS